MITRFGLTNRRCRFSTAAFVAVLTILLGMQASLQPASTQEANDDEPTEIAVEAYLYAYPLVIMERDPASSDQLRGG